MEHNEETIGEEILPSESEGTQDEHPMDALLEAEAYEIETPRRGEIRTGTIARVTDSDVLVDVGAKSEGVITSRELDRLSPEQRAELEVGQEIEVYVLRTGGDGQLLLSLTRAEEEQDWAEVEHLLETREVYEGVVSGYNKGGLIVKVGQLRGFIPASQVSLARRRRAEGETPDQRWGKMVGEPIIAKVIEVDRRRNRLILSERAAAKEARDALKERLIAELEPGEVRTGHVISLADFGAFVDIGGADGLVHLSELSWKRVSHPREVLKVGQEVAVKVLSVDPERRRISLSLRELEANPWDEIMSRYKEGQLVEGTITKLTKFGAFASLKGTDDYVIEGLIHISELADHRVEHPKEVVQEGETLTLRLIKIDRERRRVGLSLKRVDSSEYADIDWQVAMTEGSGGAVEAQAEAEVEDFDAALEAEEPFMPPDEAMAEEAGEPEAAPEEPAAKEAGEPEAAMEEAGEPEAAMEEAGEPEAVVEEAAEPEAASPPEPAEEMEQLAEEGEPEGPKAEAEAPDQETQVEPGEEQVDQTENPEAAEEA